MVQFRLHELLEEKNITRYKISKETKIDINAINKICNNTSRQVRFDTLEKILDFLDCNLSDLLIEVPDELQNNI